MLDQIPAEICAHVFDFACRDSGYTGRSLSLVSRYIRATSEAAKLQSIALVNRRQILAFAALLESIPPKRRTTRYLFVNGQETEEEMSEVMDAAYKEFHKVELDRKRLAALLPATDERMKISDAELARHRAQARQFMDDFGREGARAMDSIFRRLAPTLELLDLALNEYVAKMMLSPISLPRLTDLTTRCGFPLHPTNVPVLAPCPSLRRLHIVEAQDQWTWTSCFFENGVSYFAPALTHLRLSQLDQDEDAINYLEGGLGLCVPRANCRVTPLPETLELVLIKPGVAPAEYQGCSCCDDTYIYSDLLQKARQLRDKLDHRVVLLNAYASLPAEDVYFQEWMEKAGGAVCRWDTSSLDLNPADGSAE
ncbi:hypothetical protein DFH09DRAFT_1211231 [Mycena vulgaris]|nr:hypothetical protein DFH09DRAFT_1211231 [Mycena vulgaris]